MANDNVLFLKKKNILSIIDFEKKWKEFYSQINSLT